MKHNFGKTPLSFFIVLLAVFAAAFVFDGSIRAADEVAKDAPAMSDDESSQVNPGLIERLLIKKHKCPYCGQSFSENSDMLWLLIGFLGQAFFTSRFVVQWIASERKKESHFPHIFWHLSIVGSLMLLAYSISIVAWPIIIGQAFGVIVYGRNLALIARKNNAAKAEAEQKPEK